MARPLPSDAKGFTFTCGASSRARKTREIQRLDEHHSEVTRLEFHRAGRILFSSGWDRQVLAWNVESGDLALSHTGTVAGVARGGDGVAIYRGNEARLYDLVTDREFSILHGHDASVKRMGNHCVLPKRTIRGFGRTRCDSHLGPRPAHADRSRGDRLVHGCTLCASGHVASDGEYSWCSPVAVRRSRFRRQAPATPERARRTRGNDRRWSESLRPEP